jgi:hypothetical protein
MKLQIRVVIIVVLLAAASGALAGSPSAVSDTIDRETLRTEINQFLKQQLATHIGAISSLDKPPDRVLGAGTTGEFTWGTFMRAIGAYVEMTGQRQLAGRDLNIFAGQIGLLEHRLGGTRFSQLYAAQTLHHFGSTLKSNSLWNELSEQDRAKWRELLDPRKFYDPKTRNVINLPENYLGVAARLAAIDFKLGLLEDRKLLDDLLDRSAQQFTGGALFADDAPPTGRFDRYSNEYARFIWDAAETAQRADLLAALKPTLTTQMRLWWDLVKEDGYGYAWGRSLGVVSYLDTLEIVAFVAQHREFRPAPLPDLASAYLNAWRWLRRDYRDDAHLLSVFAKGRGNYRYITPEREWQQTVGFFGKVADAHMKLMPILEREKVSKISSRLSLPDVSRFVFFRNDPRKAGVWLVREGPLSFTLPITTGTQPGVSDYLPAPHGLAGFAAPVEQLYPSLVPYLELEGNQTIVASDGADEIEPSSDGRSIRVVWRRWAAIGAKPGTLIDPHITSEVAFRIEGSTLVREERLTASVPVTIRLWRFALPTTAGNVNRSNDAQNWIRLESSDGNLEVQPPIADWPLKEEVVSTGDTALGRGPRLSIPLHIVYESRDIHLEAGRSVRWRIELRAATSVSQVGDRKTNEKRIRNGN